MFQISYVRHLQDRIVHAALCGMFFTHLCKLSSGLEDVLMHIFKPAWIVGRPSGLTSPMSDSTGGDAWVTEDDLKKSSTEVWRDSNCSSPEQFLHIKQPPCSFLVWLSLLAARSSQCPQTHWCQIHWIYYLRSTSKSSWSSSSTQTQIHQLLQRRFALISVRWSSLSSWWWHSSNSKTSAASYVRTGALGVIRWVWGQTTKSGTAYVGWLLY